MTTPPELPAGAELPAGVTYCLSMWLALTRKDPAEAYRIAKLGLADDSIDDAARAELSSVVEFTEAWLKKRYPHLSDSDFSCL